MKNLEDLSGHALEVHTARIVADWIRQEHEENRNWKVLPAPHPHFRELFDRDYHTYAQEKGAVARPPELGHNVLAVCEEEGDTAFLAVPSVSYSRGNFDAQKIQRFTLEEIFIIDRNLAKSARNAGHGRQLQKNFRLRVTNVLPGVIFPDGKTDFE